MQIHVDNADGELLPGAFANINFQSPGDETVMSAPASALMFDKAGLRVSTVDANNRIVLKTVTIMRDLGKTIELASGLVPGDRVIESPPDGIADGDGVRISHAAGKPDRTNGPPSGGKAAAWNRIAPNAGGNPSSSASVWTSRFCTRTGSAASSRSAARSQNEKCSCN